MSKKDLIETVLSKPQYFLMYPAGAGGEFLNVKILEYSKKFSWYKLDFYSTEENRTIIKAPQFYFKLFNSLPYETITYDKMVEHLDSILTIDDVERAIRMIDMSNAPLIRCHPLMNEYFYYKTYFINVYESKWYEYCSILSMLKEMIDVSDYGYAVDLAKMQAKYVSGVQPFDENHYDNLKTFIKDLDLAPFHKFRLHVLLRPFINNRPDFKTCFDTDIKELFYQHKNSIYISPEKGMEKFKNYFKGNRSVLIDYDKFFIKGYLESIFEIESDDFHTDLIDWHERNLELMSQNGFDYQKFLL